MQLLSISKYGEEMLPGLFVCLFFLTKDTFTTNISVKYSLLMRLMDNNPTISAPGNWNMINVVLWGSSKHLVNIEERLWLWLDIEKVSTGTFFLIFNHDHNLSLNFTKCFINLNLTKHGPQVTNPGLQSQSHGLCRTSLTPSLCTVKVMGRKDEKETCFVESTIHIAHDLCRLIFRLNFDPLCFVFSSKWSGFGNLHKLVLLLYWTVSDDAAPPGLSSLLGG